jgi:hypothetical protein
MRRLGKLRKTKSGLVVRSGLELLVAEQLDKAKVKYKYEGEQLEWKDYNPRVQCDKCGVRGRSFQTRRYTPDFTINGTRVEVKGRLTSRDRKTLNGVLRDNPGCKLYIIFGADNKLSKSSKTRYSDWAKKNKIEYSLKGIVPKEWIELWVG